MEDGRKARRRLKAPSKGAGRDWREFMRTQEIRVVPIGEVKPYPNNPRKNDAAVPRVAESIRAFGFRTPILVDADGTIIEGHTRRLAAISLGMEEVPVIFATDLTPDEVKALRIIDNKTAECAEWDMDRLADEMSKLTDFAFTDFGFSANDFAKMGIADAGMAEDDDFDVKEDTDGRPDVEVRTARGEIWLLGRHRLMCGDSTDVADVRALMGGENADLLLTDPPYNVAYKGRTDEGLTIENDNMDDARFLEFLTAAFRSADAVMRPGAAFYVFHASCSQRKFENALEAVGLEVRQQLIWAKDNFSLGRQDYQWNHEPLFYGWKDGAAHTWNLDRCQTTVLKFPKPLRNAIHPTMKPIALCRYLMENSSNHGDAVLDLFGGSGSTLMAAERAGRRCFMMEFDPKYATVIIGRWEAETGERAVRVDANAPEGEGGLPR